MLRVLFVCTGNTCRSSMAEGLAKRLIKDMSLEGRLSVSSAGIAALDGMPAAGHAVGVMAERGIDLTAHQARLLKDEYWCEADLVLTMTKGHKEALKNSVPEDKLFTLGEFAGIDNNISDPIGGSSEVYRECADQLKELIELLIMKLMEEEA